VGTSVTVVVVGDDGELGGHPGELPGVRMLARTGDPRRAPRLVGDARSLTLGPLPRDWKLDIASLYGRDDELYLRYSIAPEPPPGA
jgi:hypothetical protein